MKKRLLAMVLTAVMVTGMTACGSRQAETVQPEEGSDTQVSGAEPEESKDVTDIDWPTKNINIIVPYSAGGDTDFNARAIAQYLSEELGVNVVVTNVTGSGGSVASNQVRDSAADGYTILCNHTSLNMNTATGIIDWDYSDLEMGCIFALGLGEAVIVRGDAPWDTIEDLIKDSQENPGVYNCAASTGATTQWPAIAMNNAGAKLNVVDAGSASDRVTALLGGHVDIICNSLSSVKDYLATGDFKCLGTCTPERSTEYPDIPTLTESNVACSYNMAYTFLFPGGTDPQIAEKLAEACRNIVENNEEYAKSIYETYQQQPVCYTKAESEDYYADELTRLMEISDILQGTAN